MAFARAHAKVTRLALLSFLAVNSAASLPSLVQLVTFSGNQVFTSRQLVDAMASRAGLVYSPAILESDMRSIVDRYRVEGYLDATVALAHLDYSADSSLVDVNMRIDEGRQSVMGTVAVEGLSHFAATDLLPKFESRSGEPLNQEKLEQDIEGLLGEYDRAGYPFAQCAVSGVVRRQGSEVDSLDVLLTVVEGDRMTIEEIRVEGNKETDPSVVVRETRLAVGETFNPVKVEAIRPRLQRLNIFSDVSEPILYTRNHKGGVLITVREGNTNTFDGVIGYIPATTTGQRGYVTGLASISMRNLFGTGRKLSFRWQREDRHSQELGVRYVEPWVIGFPVNLGGGFLQRQQDTSYVRRVVDVKTELMISEELSASLLFGSESVIPSASVVMSRVLRSLTTSIGAELQYDTRDDIISPTEGAFYRTDYTYGTKRISSIPASLQGTVPGKVTVQRFALDLRFHLPTFTRQLMAFGLYGRELRSGQLEEGEMFRLGGARTLRGYRENQFIGSRVAWSNTEYRLLLARRSFIYVFLDGGYYLRPADAVRSLPKTDAFKYGYGIGVQLETGLGNLGVSFALGQGDTFATGKVHFGLINEF
jgi:outer membrane protein insertion porin family